MADKKKPERKSLAPKKKAATPSKHEFVKEGNHWYILKDGKKHGPYSMREHCDNWLPKL